MTDCCLCVWARPQPHKRLVDGLYPPKSRGYEIDSANGVDYKKVAQYAADKPRHLPFISKELDARMHKHLRKGRYGFVAIAVRAMGAIVETSGLHGVGSPPTGHSTSLAVFEDHVTTMLLALLLHPVADMKLEAAILCTKFIAGQDYLADQARLDGFLYPLLSVARVGADQPHSLPTVSPRLAAAGLFAATAAVQSALDPNTTGNKARVAALEALNQLLRKSDAQALEARVRTCVPVLLSTLQRELGLRRWLQGASSPMAVESRPNQAAADSGVQQNTAAVSEAELVIEMSGPAIQSAQSTTVAPALSPPSLIVAAVDQCLSTIAAAVNPATASFIFEPLFVYLDGTYWSPSYLTAHVMRLVDPCGFGVEPDAPDYESNGSSQANNGTAPAVLKHPRPGHRSGGRPAQGLQSAGMLSSTLPTSPAGFKRGSNVASMGAGSTIGTMMTQRLGLGLGRAATGMTLAMPPGALAARASYNTPGFILLLRHLEAVSDLFESHATSSSAAAASGGSAAQMHATADGSSTDDVPGVAIAVMPPPTDPFAHHQRLPSHSDPSLWWLSSSAPPPAGRQQQAQSAGVQVMNADQRSFDRLRIGLLSAVNRCLAETDPDVAVGSWVQDILDHVLPLLLEAPSPPTSAPAAADESSPAPRVVGKHSRVQRLAQGVLQSFCVRLAAAPDLLRFTTHVLEVYADHVSEFLPLHPHFGVFGANATGDNSDLGAGTELDEGQRQTRSDGSVGVRGSAAAAAALLAKPHPHSDPKLIRQLSKQMLRRMPSAEAVLGGGIGLSSRQLSGGPAAAGTPGPVPVPSAAGSDTASSSALHEASAHTGTIGGSNNASIGHLTAGRASRMTMRRPSLFAALGTLLEQAHIENAGTGEPVPGAVDADATAFPSSAPAAATGTRELEMTPTRLPPATSSSSRALMPNSAQSHRSLNTRNAGNAGSTRLPMSMRLPPIAGSILSSSSLLHPGLVPAHGSSIPGGDTGAPMPSLLSDAQLAELRGAVSSVLLQIEETRLRLILPVYLSLQRLRAVVNGSAMTDSDDYVAGASPGAFTHSTAGFGAGGAGASTSISIPNEMLAGLELVLAESDACIKSIGLCCMHELLSADARRSSIVDGPTNWVQAAAIAVRQCFSEAGLWLFDAAATGATPTPAGSDSIPDNLEGSAAGDDSTAPASPVDRRDVSGLSPLEVLASPSTPALQSPPAAVDTFVAGHLRVPAAGAVDAGPAAAPPQPIIGWLSAGNRHGYGSGLKQLTERQLTRLCSVHFHAAKDAASFALDSDPNSPAPSRVALQQLASRIPRDMLRICGAESIWKLLPLSWRLLRGYDRPATAASGASIIASVASALGSQELAAAAQELLVSLNAADACGRVRGDGLIQSATSVAASRSPAADNGVSLGLAAPFEVKLRVACAVLASPAVRSALVRIGIPVSKDGTVTEADMMRLMTSAATETPPPTAGNSNETPFSTLLAVRGSASAVFESMVHKLTLLLHAAPALEASWVVGGGSMLKHALIAADGLVRVEVESAAVARQLQLQGLDDATGIDAAADTPPVDDTEVPIDHTDAHGGVYTTGAPSVHAAVSAPSIDLSVILQETRHGHHHHHVHGHGGHQQHRRGSGSAAAGSSRQVNVGSVHGLNLARKSGDHGASGTTSGSGAPAPRQQQVEAYVSQLLLVLLCCEFQPLPRCEGMVDVFESETDMRINLSAETQHTASSQTVLASSVTAAAHAQQQAKSDAGAAAQPTPSDVDASPVPSSPPVSAAEAATAASHGLAGGPSSGGPLVPSLFVARRATSTAAAAGQAVPSAPDVAVTSPQPSTKHDFYLGGDVDAVIGMMLGPAITTSVTAGSAPMSAVPGASDMQHKPRSALDYELHRKEQQRQQRLETRQGRAQQLQVQRSWSNDAYEQADDHHQALHFEVVDDGPNSAFTSGFASLSLASLDVAFDPSSASASFLTTAVGHSRIRAR